MVRSNYLEQVNAAYARLTYDQLVIFLVARGLSTIGTEEELAYRLAEYDIETYRFPQDTNGPGSRNGVSMSGSKPRTRQAKAPDLPVEILAEIMDHIGDWELAKAVGVPSCLPPPLDWTQANQTDHAVLTGYLPLIRAADPAAHPPTKVSAILAVRFGYVNVLEYFLIHHPPIFRSLYHCDLLPITAAIHGRISVLSWWRHARELHPVVITMPSMDSVIKAIDGASRHGHVVSLEWWYNSGLPFLYTEAALEMASAKNHIEVLSWWKRKNKECRLPMKIGKVMDMASNAGHVGVLDWWARNQPEIKYDKLAMYHASCHGRVDVLQWWLDSGLQLIFDPDALIGATKHNRPEVLEWWDKSGLPIQYRMCDIEEALEDAIGGGEAARQWWTRKGVDFNANDTVWMKLQNLN
ncbi:hypothetical protein BDW22DRAFT_1204154 [Trametopsis cervina]|nr:hypothetical protein BDW22DRAFT_1204154 [Trametopsis cervina]